MNRIARIAFPRKDRIGDTTWRNIGIIAYDAEKQYARVLLQGWQFGAFFGKAIGENAPYLEGDLFAWTGDYKRGPDGQPTTQKKYIWCGYMGTNDSNGVMYWGVLKTMPFVAIREADTGVWLKLFRADDAKAPVPESGRVNAELDAAASEQQQEEMTDNAEPTGTRCISAADEADLPF